MTHPIVRNAQVYYPGSTTLVPLDQGRLFGGPELIDPGLTLAVFPLHTHFDVIKGAPEALNASSVLYSSKKFKKFDTLSAGEDKERGHYAGIKLMVQLFYREASYNQPQVLKAEYIDTSNDPNNPSYGYYFQYLDSTNIETEPIPLNNKSREFATQTSLAIQTLPGEEVLTQWGDIIKYAIRDVKYLQPYASIRNPYIIASDYPTSTWSSQDANLIFHTCYHVVEFDVSEPPLPPQVQLGNINEINLGVNKLR